MSRFDLPTTSPQNKAAFADASRAAQWLSEQPLANAPAMLCELTRQLEALTVFRMEARVRFKTLEALRKTIFAVDGESQRRYENRPLPLSPPEQATLDTTGALWRACAVGYLHCLQACLNQEAGTEAISLLSAHRALVCLRMAQMSAYLGGQKIDAALWQTLHAIFAACEKLGIQRDSVSDRLLPETRESTPQGQYTMALLLHLARPYELTRAQFSAVTRWLARWREQAEVVIDPGEHSRSRCIPVDLSQGHPALENGSTPLNLRWLLIGNVLRKIRKRMELLEEGESPEELKLGSGLSSELCLSLLKTLSDNLRQPLPDEREPPAGAASIAVVGGLEAIHRQLGGKRLKVEDTTVHSNHRTHDQIAIFGHAVREADPLDKIVPESWLLADEDGAHLSVCRLRTPDETAGARLAVRNLLAVRHEHPQHFSLAVVCRLLADAHGSLHVRLRCFAGDPQAQVAEVRERQTGRISRQAAFLLPASLADGAPPTIILPAGIPARAQAIALLQERTLPIRPVACLERGGDFERWTYEAS